MRKHDAVTVNRDLSKFYNNSRAIKIWETYKISVLNIFQTIMTELTILLTISKINYLVPCIAFRITPIIATKSLLSTENSLQSLHLLYGLKSKNIKSSCSSFIFGKTTTGISSSFVCPPFPKIDFPCHYTYVFNHSLSPRPTVVLSQ
jgi:hypothetical protein